MSLLIKMAWLNIWRNKRRAAILLMAMVAGLVGVIFSLGVVSGWISQMIDTAVGTTESHVKVMATGFHENPVIENHFVPPRALHEHLRTDARVRGWSDRVQVSGLLSTADQSVLVTIIGVDPVAETTVSVIPNAIVKGDFFTAARTSQIVVGDRLAQRISKGIGKKVVLTSQQLGGELGAAALRIAGVFDTGNSGFDEHTVYVRKDVLQDMLGMHDEITETAIALHDIDMTEVVSNDLRRRVQSEHLQIYTWQERLPFIVQTLSLSKRMMAPYYGIFYLAMAFGVLNTLLMAIGERTHEIGVLMAIGMRPRNMILVIVMESFMLSALAAAIGLTVGSTLVLWLGHTGIDLGSLAAGANYFGLGRTLRPQFDPGMTAAAAVATIAIGVIFSLQPAFHAVWKTPVEAMNSRNA